MKIISNIACRDGVTIESRIQRRWAMNFAAAVADTSPCYYGDSDSELVVHPLYQAQLEWRLRKLLTSGAGVPGPVRERAVHAAQYLRIGRLFRVEETVTTRGEIIGVVQGRSGVRLTTRFDTSDRHGEHVSTAVAVTVYRGIGLAGEPVIPPATPGRENAVGPVPPARCRRKILNLDRGAGHTYGECARIWNPVHSDLAVALRAGLPGTIMHGSGLLAMSVSDVIRNEGTGDPSAVSMVTARFRAPVVLPHRPALHVSAPVRRVGTREISFWLVREDGEPAMTGTCTLK